MTVNQFVIRPAREGEEEILYQLITELATFEKNHAGLRSLKKENLSRWGFGEKPFFHTEFVEVDGQIVGYALYYFGFTSNLGYPILYVEDLYVKPDFRNQGLGKGLLTQLARYAEEQDCIRMVWHVFDWNEPALKFYESLGAFPRKDLMQMRLEKESLKKLIPSGEMNLSDQIYEKTENCSPVRKGSLKKTNFC